MGASGIPADARRTACMSAAALLLLSTACPYGFGGNLPGHLSTVRIAPFRSSTAEYGLEQELTALFVEEILSSGRLTIVTTSPDALIEAQVTGFFRTPYSYSSSEVVEEYRMEIRIALEFSDLVMGVPVLEQETVDRWIVYDPLNESYEAAKQRLLEDAAGEMARRCLSGW